MNVTASSPSQTGPTPIPDTLTSVCDNADPIDSFNEIARKRYGIALSAGHVSPHWHSAIIIVTPIAGTDSCVVRVDGEADPLTISRHPVQAAGYILRHIRGSIEATDLHVRGPDGGAFLLSTSVGDVDRLAGSLIRDGEMEKPLALQHHASSNFLTFETAE
ncbi:hypothetical protein [Ancylobacter terrae]|uniref:hypothetical protein n=1 Tax=Ancylobacter sp. sgz301288 TaxID=3342077 RepID=UPI00385E9238